MHKGVIQRPSKGRQPVSSLRRKRITDNTKSAGENKREGGGTEREDKECGGTKKRTMGKMNNGWSGKVITGVRDTERGENDMKGRED